MEESWHKKDRAVRDEREREREKSTVVVEDIKDNGGNSKRTVLIKTLLSGRG